MSLATYQEFVKDCRSVFKQIEKGRYYTISMQYAGDSHEIFVVSIYEESHDGAKKHLTATSREFKDNTAFYLHFVRDTLANLVVTVHGKPRFVIEPHEEITKYLLHRLNLSSLNDLTDIFLGGYQSAGRPLRREAIKKITYLQSSADSLKNKVAEEPGKTAGTNDELYVLNSETKRLRDNAKYWENRARELESREGSITPVGLKEDAKSEARFKATSIATRNYHFDREAANAR
jgi:FtsZ-binding cell division protein ZapB